MDINAANIEQIVKQVLANMKSGAPAAASAPRADSPKTAKVAMLTQLERFKYIYMRSRVMKTKDNKLPTQVI